MSPSLRGTARPRDGLGGLSRPFGRTAVGGGFRDARRQARAYQPKGCRDDAGIITRLNFSDIADLLLMFAHHAQHTELNDGNQGSIHSQRVGILEWEAL
jgi:hypothetical protein